MIDWPFPGDSPLVRARRVAQTYRARLELLDPGQCATVDTLMHDLGEAWVAPQVITCGMDDWLTPGEAADIANVKPATLRQWRARGRIEGRRDTDGAWIYQARDVFLALSTVRSRVRE